MGLEPSSHSREGSGFLGLVRKQKEQLSKGWDGCELSIQQEFLEKNDCTIVHLQKNMRYSKRQRYDRKIYLAFSQVETTSPGGGHNTSVQLCGILSKFMQIHHLVS